MVKETCSSCKHFNQIYFDASGKCTLTENQRPNDTKHMLVCTPSFTCKKWKVKKS